MDGNRRPLLRLTACAILLAIAAPVQATIVVRGASTSDALALADAIVDQASGLSSASWLHYPTTPNSCNPEGTSDSAITGTFGAPQGPAFAILTSGEVNLAPTANTAANSGCAMGDTFRGANDVSILEVDLDVPMNHNCLLVDFQFLSDEFPEYVGSNFNDAFIAELDSSTWSVSGASISAPNNFAFDQNGNPITINSAGAATMNANNAAGSTYDGATDRLTAQTPLSQGGLHRVYFTIFDASDHAYDSAVFLDNLRTGTFSGSDCVAGVTNQPPPAWITPPSPCDQVLGYTVGDTASFSLQASSPSPSRTVTITNLAKPAGSTANIGTPGNPTSASFTWPTAGAAAGNYVTQWGASDDLGQPAAICFVTIHLNAPPAPVVSIDGIYDRAGAYLQGAPWGGWTATPGATAIDSNYLRISNTGNAAGTVSINFVDPAFTGPGTSSVPITNNLRYCSATGTASPASLAFTCATPPPGSRATTLAIPAGSQLWVYYELLAIPDPASNGGYVANYSASSP